MNSNIALAQKNEEIDSTKNYVISKSDEYHSQTLTGSDLSKFIHKGHPNSFKIPGTNISLKIGGYIKADFIIDLDYVGNRSEFVTGTIALDGSEDQKKGGQTTFHAKETRISFDFRSMSKSGMPIRAFIDMDFFGNSDPYSYNLRLRNAAITIGKLLVGKYWITAMDLRALPTVLDFEVVDAIVLNRTVQIRWEQSAGDNFKWAVALEDPQFSLDNPYNISGETKQYIPNIVGRIIWDHKIGHMQLSASGSQLRFVSDNLGTSSSLGFGVNFTGSVKFADHDKFLWSIALGNGWGNNVSGLSGSGADAVLNQDGSLNTFQVVNIVGGLEHYWLSNLASTIAFGYGTLKSPINRSQNAQELAATYHLNLRYGLIKNFMLGIEYMGGKQQIVDGTSGFAQRIQISARYDFN